jgi:hypothetical protein
MQIVLVVANSYSSKLQTINSCNQVLWVKVNVLCMPSKSIMAILRIKPREFSFLLWFDGGHNPDDAYKWLQDIQMIFWVMEATDAQKVMLATHRLTDEVDFWWGNTHQRMIVAGTLLTRNNVKNEFLAKYFPADVRTTKEI